MAVATSLAATAPSTHRSGYRLTLLPRPDLVGPTDAAAVLERHRRLALCADAGVALTVSLPLASFSPWSGAGLVHWVAAMLLPALWIAVLAVRGCYGTKLLTDGTAQCLRSMAGAVFLIGAALLAVPAHLHERPPLAVPVAALTLGVGSGLTRRLVRRSIARQQRRGRGVHRTLVVGHPEPVARLITDLEGPSGRGLVAVGAFLQVVDGSVGVALPVDEVLQTVDDLAVGVVVLAQGESGGGEPQGGPAEELASGLAARGVELLDRSGRRRPRWPPGVVACGTVKGALASAQSSRFAWRRPR